jgi:transcriptional regulator
MYVPPAFAVSDPDEIHALIESIGAGHLVTAGDGGPQATLLPLLVEGDLGVVRGHLARANPHARALAAAGDPVEALVIVAGADGYVSPGWYPTKAETGEVVPTWNYEVVHLRGRVRLVDDRSFVARVVEALTVQHEAGQDRPWSVHDAPAAYLEGMYRAIVGVELVVESVTAKRKLSQNRPDVDREAVRDALAAGDARSRRLAASMGAPGSVAEPGSGADRATPGGRAG